MSRRRFSSNTVRVVGALIPSDVLAKAMEREGLEGLEPQDFGLPENIRLRDAVNDAWNEAKALWWRFRSDLEQLPPDDATATSLTRERWLLPLLGLLGFEDVDVVPEAIDIGGTKYPISHMWHSTPLHLMGAKVGLDGRIAGIRGAARLSPHSLLQQFLNRSDDHLWGIASNGLKLRILRDSVSLTRQAFVEFDLEAMLNGEVFPDFILLFLVAHATRFAGDRPDDCLLERWIAAARDEGIRALDQLRSGVEAALTTLGTGLLSHPENRTLRNVVDAGDVDAKALYRYLLRLVYRLLFLFVAEDRDLLLLPDASPEIRERYRRFYSTGRFRNLASRPTTPGNTDLWEGLVALMQVLGRDEGEPRLGLPGLGSFLWAQDSIGPLVEADLGNEELLTAIRGLAYVEEDGTLRRIDFVDLGAEELGSVYESLLELHPSIKDRSFVLGAGAGSERKTTGSYYTPTELIVELLDSALDPVLEEAASQHDPEKAILALKIVDPAVGSGHFLVAAAHRVAKRLAEVRTGEPEPPENEYRHAVRDVVSRCLFAVDVNDLAVELCKVSLWLEALEPGKPLSFLDHHILVGNSLFGATPAAIAGGIPDDAFQVLTGDDKKTVSELKKRNRKERSGQDGLPFDAGHGPTSLGSEMQTLEHFDDEDLETVRAKERMLADWKTAPAYRQARLVADTWCAAFAIEKTPAAPPLTDSVFRRVRDEEQIPGDLHQRVDYLANTYSFFHWHLAFPQVFRTRDTANSPGWDGGFDVVLGNPPWERVKLQEKEFFAATSPEIASAPNKAARQRLIKKLPDERPALWASFQEALRESEAVSHFLRRSGVYPLCGRGDVNTYSVFAERMAAVMGPDGYAGIVAPLGLVTDTNTAPFFAYVMRSKRLVSAFGFENEEFIFPGVHHAYRFCILVMRGTAADSEQPLFAFFLRRVAQLRDADRVFPLSRSDINAVNPNTETAPVFRTRFDAGLVTRLHKLWPILWSDSDNQWDISFLRMFDMSGDSDVFADSDDVHDLLAHGNIRLSEDLRMVPLYEAKMFHLFDHRFGTYEGQSPEQARQGKLPELSEMDHRDPILEPQPRYWVDERLVDERLVDSPPVPSLVSWRNITGATNARTLIMSVVPRTAVGHSAPLLFTTRVSLMPSLLAYLTSFLSDFVARQKLSGVNFTYQFFRQLPVPPPERFGDAFLPQGGSYVDFFTPRVTELVATSSSVTDFALEYTRDARPFRWDGSRREILRAELDAGCFTLAGLSREEASRVLESFRVIRLREQGAYGSFRTKTMILDVFDRMARAIETGEPYQTALYPPPADPSLRVDVEASE